MVDILSFGVGKTEGRKEGMEMRCVQNGRLERKEEREARITTGLRERVYIAALAGLPKRRRRNEGRRAMLMKQRQVACLVHVIRFAPERPVAGGRVIGFHI